MLFICPITKLPIYQILFWHGKSGVNPHISLFSKSTDHNITLRRWQILGDF
jgi:hypothetical protein